MAQGVLSEDCKTRMRASNEFLRYSRSHQVAGLKRTLEQDYPSAALYLRDAMQFVQELGSAGEVTEAVWQMAVDRSSDSPARSDGQTAEAASRLVDAVLDRLRTERPVNQLHLMLSLLEWARSPDPTVASVFWRAVTSLLKDQDSQIRTVAAVALVDLAPGHAGLPTYEELMSLMLDGLTSTDSSVRYVASLKVMPNLHPDLCYNPLDAPEIRQEAVRALRRRWDDVFATLHSRAELLQ
jgi:hypothetical protein